MNILVINSGSSSIKSQYFVDKITIASLTIENIGDEDRGKYTLEYQGQKSHPDKNLTDHHQVLEALFEIFVDAQIISSVEDIDAVGHRVVHGGDLFNQPTLITQEILDDILSVSHLAPLHNPANMDGIKIIQKKYPQIPQVAIFDTAFHQTMPPVSYLYPLPNEFYEEHHYRRYGFHGTSHHFVAKRAATLLDKTLSQLNLITLHLGNGASVTAIQNGKSIDTSMGLTPLEGLMMGSRCGDIDPAIVIQMQRDLGLTLDQVDQKLNKESGLKAICGENDMRTIEAQAQSGDERSQLALDMFIYRIKKYIGAYTVVLGRVDALIFTGGIGEHSAIVRERVCEGLEASLHIAIDSKKNSIPREEDRSIEKSESRSKIFVIATNEELEIATQTQDLIANVTHLPY